MTGIFMVNIVSRVRGKFFSLRHQYLDDFIFIHINKTGGSSVEKALKIPFEHKTALEKINEIGLAVWERKYTFAIVRNPWDKVVSHFHYRVQTNQTSLGENSIDFKEWVHLAYGEKNTFYRDNEKMFMPQTDWISDKNGKILVNKVVHFENLSAEFFEVCQMLGKNLNLPHVKASKREHYKGYYDDKTALIINNCFKRDIENFGYKF